MFSTLCRTAFYRSSSLKVAQPHRLLVKQSVLYSRTLSSTSYLLNQDASTSIKASKSGLVESLQTAAVTPSLWTTEEVCSWASSLGLKQAHVKKLFDNEITGKALLTVTKQELVTLYGLPAGPASELYQAVEGLKTPTVKSYKVTLNVSEDRKRFLASPSLDTIYLPPNPDRFFSFSGPVDFKKHYCIPSFLRSDSMKRDRLMSLIQQEKYFVLHEQRQSGKTSYLRDLRDELNSTGEYAALYINIEAAQQYWNHMAGTVQTILEQMDIQCVETFGCDFQLNHMFGDKIPTQALERALTFLSKELAKQNLKFVLLVDEIDSISGDPLLTVLRQLRSGYERRPQSFPTSIVLVGVRDVRDYRIFSAEQKTHVLGGSAFNISAESARLPRFSRAHVNALAKQHSSNTGQVIEDLAIDKIMEWTDGQPWCVNRVFYESVSALVQNRSEPITADVIDRAVNNVILSRATHLENFTTILREPRVKSVIEPFLVGGDIPDHSAAEYVEDLGLIKRDKNGKFIISNKIYSEILPRQLIIEDNALTNRLEPVRTAFYVDETGHLKVEMLIDEFRKFVRENGELCPGAYKEAITHLLFMAFCQRVVNGGGSVFREFALGTDRVDILIKWPRVQPVQYEIVEIKRCRAEKDKLESIIKAGVEQVVGYLSKKGLDKGYLIVSKECRGEFTADEFAAYERERHITTSAQNFTVQTYIIPRQVE